MSWIALAVPIFSSVLDVVELTSLSLMSFAGDFGYYLWVSVTNGVELWEKCLYLTELFLIVKNVNFKFERWKIVVYFWDLWI